MISITQLEAWLRAGESEAQKFKRTTGERRTATQVLWVMVATLRETRALVTVEIWP